MRVDCYVKRQRPPERQPTPVSPVCLVARAEHAHEACPAKTLMQCYASGEGRPLSIDMQERPFRILGVQPNRCRRARQERPRQSLCRPVSASSAPGNYKSERENVDEDIVRIGKGALAVEIDLMQPSIRRRSQGARPQAEPLRPLGDDLHAAVEWLGKKARFTPAASARAQAATTCASFIRRATKKAPIGGQGTLIELVQAPGSDRGAGLVHRFIRIDARRTSCSSQAGPMAPGISKALARRGLEIPIAR